MDQTSLDNPVAFVRANTIVGRLPFIGEISLHLAHEVVPLWTQTETLRQGAMPPPYWAFAWAGGQALARFLLDNPCEVAGQRVLDFGAGSGLVGIAAAKSGALATCADIDPLSIAAIQLNAAMNAVSVATIDGDILDTEETWPLILVGDMCYERPLAERLLSWLSLQAKAGSRILLGDPGRSYLPTTGLRRLATYSVPTPKDLEDRDIRETSVYVWQE